MPNGPIVIKMVACTQSNEKTYTHKSKMKTNGLAFLSFFSLKKQQICPLHTDKIYSFLGTESTFQHGFLMIPNIAY